MDTTAKLSCFVVFILIGSTVFSLTFQGVDGHHWVEHLLTRPAGRRARLPDRRQHPGVRAGVLPRLLRAGVHRRAAAGAGGGEAAADAAADVSIDSDGLVRRAAGGEHADLVHAPAVRLRAVLPAQRRAARCVRRPHHAQDDRAGHHRSDLLGRGSVRDHPADHGRDRDRVAAHGDRRVRYREEDRPRQGQDRARGRPAAGDRSAPRACSPRRARARTAARPRARRRRPRRKTRRQAILRSLGQEKK